MAAEVARAAGLEVDVYEGKGSVGRKFLIAGKGGLNLTHSEPLETFVSRYGERAADVRAWLEQLRLRSPARLGPRISASRPSSAAPAGYSPRT